MSYRSTHSAVHERVEEGKAHLEPAPRHPERKSVARLWAIACFLICVCTCLSAPLAVLVSKNMYLLSHAIEKAGTASVDVGRPKRRVSKRLRKFVLFTEAKRTYEKQGHRMNEFDQYKSPWEGVTPVEFNKDVAAAIGELAEIVLAASS